jgi:hypothetical protein
MSSATLAPFPKLTSMALAEKPDSGVTLTAGIPAEQKVWLGWRSPVVAKTWTNPLLARAIPRQVDIDGERGAKVTSTSAAAALTSPEFGATLEQLRDLLNDEDEQDRPSEEAFDRTIAFLRDTANKLGMNFPRAVAATGPGRSVRLLWASNEKELRVVIGGTPLNRSYIYWRDSGRSGVDDRINTEQFAKYLSWISQRL